MITWIGKAYIERLARRFSLGTYQARANQFRLSDVVIPTTSADELLTTPQFAFSAGIDISAAPSYVAFFSVPIGKRWTLRSVWREGTTGNSRVCVYESAAKYVNLSVTATAEAVILGLNQRMVYGQSIGMISTGNGADNARTMSISYEEEDDY